MKTIDIIAGARPNFMKIAPIIRELISICENGFDLKFRLVHTGQHYDPLLSSVFFEQLGIPEPYINLEVGSGTQAEQTAAIMVRYESFLYKEKCDLCLVVGDINSTMACSITAQKLGIKVAHVEAGIRSDDWSMPEEINRRVTDSITNFFFTTSKSANENLKKNGVSEDRIFFVGNTMIDSLLYNIPRLIPPKIPIDFKFNVNEYFILTLHRPSNVDDQSKLLEMLSLINTSARGIPVLFPVHPRTRKILGKYSNLPIGIKLIDPQPYLEFIWLIKHAKAVITDSGGISEETTVLGIPCMTLRDSTERPETVDVGTNELIGKDPNNLLVAFDRLFDGRWKEGAIPERWDGKSAKRIVSQLVQLLSS